MGGSAPVSSLAKPLLSSSATSPGVAAPDPFVVMAKPMGPICNLECKYCYYLDKAALYPSTKNFRMPNEVLVEYVRQYIASQAGPEVNFAWQGGEPTLLGVDYFRRVVELQNCFADGKKIGNAIQTNGTLLDEEWCAFFRENSFLVGVSVDGPKELHDRYRVDKGDRSTFDKVMTGIELLKRHGVEFNTLTVLHRDNVKHPHAVYDFLKRIGSTFLQFIPLVERRSGVGLAEPPLGRASLFETEVTPWSLLPKDFGEFLVAMFHEWVRRDVGRTFVQLFDVALSNWMGLGSPLCLFAETCGRAVALEHNGDVYSCDHYVYPRYQLGNVLNADIVSMVSSSKQLEFGATKSDSLPAYCKRCDVRFACNGECPKNRFVKTPDGEAGLNYLCEGYRHFFRTVDPYMRAMASLLRAGRPPALVMGMVAEGRIPGLLDAINAQHPERNDPCPCGSGEKYKRCHGR
jgi:uncharacterized protein